MRCSLLHHCSRMCTASLLQRAARLEAACRGFAGPSSSRHLNQRRSTARAERAGRSARRSAASAAQAPDSKASRLQQDGQAAEPAASAVPSDSGGSDRRAQLDAAPASGMYAIPDQQASMPAQWPPKKKKKVVPWPTLVGKGTPLPSDPQTWQCAAVLVDKPVGWTSFDVCGKLRSALRIKKVGHAGTLDPNATGLLIVCIGKGCKRVDSFVAMDKVYSGMMRLGQATPSFDAETEVSTRAEWRHISDEALAAGAASFLGDAMQLPPMYSAVRIKGQRLYLAARAGETVEREQRAIRVSKFDVWRDAPDSQDVCFRICCSKGTYIRSLANDLGEALGSAAHVVALRRENIGAHSVEDAWQMRDLAEAIHGERERLGIPNGKPISVPEDSQPTPAATTAVL